MESELTELGRNRNALRASRLRAQRAFPGSTKTPVGASQPDASTLFRGTERGSFFATSYCDGFGSMVDRFFLELRQLTARDVFCRVMQSAAQLVYRVQPAQPCTASDAASALRKLLYAPPLLENRCARAQDLAAPRVYCLLKSMRRPPQRQLCRSPESPPFVFKEKVGVGLFCEL